MGLIMAATPPAQAIRQKQKIDIEKALIWAYRDELPKQSVGGLTGWERSIFLGYIDDKPREYSLPVALGPPHPDALLLDHAVRNLPTIGIDWKRSREHLMGDLAGWLTDDNARVAHMSVSSAALVMGFARMGARPRWDLGAARVRPKLGKNGKPEIYFVDDAGALVCGITTTGRRYGPGARCKTYLDPDPAEIASARFEYLVWRQALASLVKGSWNYADHILTGPTAAAAPWLVDDEAKGRVLRTVNK